MTEKLVVRSYRRVFRFDRRIYRIDRFALPVPGGVPLVGVLWFLAALLAVILAGQLPALGSLTGSLSPPLRYLILPAAVGVLATQLAPDGRSAPRFTLTWLGRRLRARRCSAGRPVTAERERALRLLAVRARFDEHGAELRRGRVRGPARLIFRDPVHVTRRRGRAIFVRASGGARRRRSRGELVRELELHASERVEIRP